jgi:hypothetical protein
MQVAAAGHGRTRNRALKSAGLAAAGALSVACACAAYALVSGRWQPPPEWSPWVPLDLAAEPNFLTRYKLSRLSSDAALCAAVLEGANMTFERLPDRETGTACGLFDAVTIERTASAVGDAFSLTCRTAVSLALWEKHVLEPAAERHFGSAVERIEHFGSYSCRNVYGRPNATRSRHATAEAFDIAGFVLADGRRIRVLADWDEDTPEARFLREVRDGACRFFDGVLSPDYNAAHRDHFHLDRGPYRICR